MKPLVFSVMLVLFAEIGVALVMFNAAPHLPLGFWPWSGGLAVLSPAAGVWIYGKLTRRETLNVEIRK